MLQLVRRGGSSWVRVSCDEMYAAVMEADPLQAELMLDLFDQAARASVVLALERGKHVVIDRCNFNTTQRTAWLEATRASGQACCVTALCLDVPPALCLQRIQQREGHPRLASGAPSEAEGLRRLMLNTKLTTPGSGEGFDRVVWADCQQILDKEIHALANVSAQQCHRPSVAPGFMCQGEDALFVTAASRAICEEHGRLLLKDETTEPLKPSQVDRLTQHTFRILAAYLSPMAMKRLFQACSLLHDDTDFYHQLFSEMVDQQFRKLLLKAGMDLDILFKGLQPREDVNGRDADLYIAGSCAAQVTNLSVSSIWLLTYVIVQVLLGVEWEDSDVDLYTTAERVSLVRENLVTMGLHKLCFPTCYADQLIGGRCAASTQCSDYSHCC